MANSQKLREAVERAICETLDAHVSSLTSELIDSACRELAPLVAERAPSSPAAPETPAGGSPTDLLNAAVAGVMDCQSQADILASLLDGATKFSHRSALFVIKAGTAVGWRARGFDDNDAIKSISFDPGAGLAGRAFVARQPAQAAAAEFDAAFIERFGEPLVGTNAIVLPLILREKVAALIYADAGGDGRMDPSALECLTRAASLWLEIVAARKAGTAIAPAEAPEEDQRTGTQRMAAVADTEVESESPAPEPPEAPAMSAPTPEPVPEPVSEVASAAAAAASAPDTETSLEDEELHKKAKRFAKLLVDEIKLYNQQKVAEGRSSRDLYRRLKDDIDKSRASYDKRYGQTVAASGNYFSQELVRILCEGDASLLGSGFSV